MTDDRLAVAVRATPWRGIVDTCSAAVGPFSSVQLRSWRIGLDAVESRVHALESAGHYLPDRGVGVSPPGLHALVAISAVPRRHFDELVDVGAAVELAYRATCHHKCVRDAVPVDGGGSLGDSNNFRDNNKRHVLDGDWAITQAAVLVADIGPTAYRLLVRGYGAAQLARLESRPTAALLTTAVLLGRLVSGGDATEISATPGSLLYRWACSLLDLDLDALAVAP
ncbi:MAG: hypothetical protein ACRDV3_05640 [Acidothermaceae bacterium]